MKKNYISPVLEVTVLAFNQQLLAGSALGTSVFGDNADIDIDVLAPELDIDALSPSLDVEDVVFGL